MFTALNNSDPCTFECLSRNQQNLLPRYSSHDKVLRPTAPISVNWIPIRRISGIVPVDELRRISRFPREDDSLPTHLPFSFAICFGPRQQKGQCRPSYFEGSEFPFDEYE